MQEITTPPQSALASHYGKPHRLLDGAPLSHWCRVLPAAPLAATPIGDSDRAIALLAQAAPLQEHSGVWKLRRRR
jgi:hypothetical protein